ncbi:hypothetical protein [Pedobacter cryoconitis]|uniref:Uncharacterized protein n=1 Tax=Pedobacter cryoconitis TaxID=188932 RepID=A0A7X0J298_9SPHI|nr:hypothetical protein [Pedobacter cryoconitis]MBB6499117.1 hypothetical protein [Pedobacter cryoconitis]
MPGAAHELFQCYRKKLVGSLNGGPEHSKTDTGRWQGDALIRSNFSVDPERLQLSEWAKLHAQAQWLERWRLENQAELFKVMFGA